ncbi:hypothetical protein STENM223S_02833 [Streptomyces tendae]
MTSAITCSGAMPTSAATASATALLSPVSRMGVRPSPRSRSMASGLVSLTASATSRTARASPSQATAMAVRPAASASALAHRQDSSGRDIAHSSSSFSRPTRTAWPSTMPWTPRPAMLAKSSGAGSVPTRAAAPEATAWAMGCSEECSRAPARRRTSSSPVPSAVCTASRVVRW